MGLVPSTQRAQRCQHVAARPGSFPAAIVQTNPCLGLASPCADNAYTPHRLETLVGRVHVAAAALGRQHTLLLDSDGQAWACGENKEGQVRTGAP